MSRRDFAALFMATALAFAGAAGWFLRTLQPIFAPPVDDERIAAAAHGEPGAWLVYGHTPAEQRFSALAQINQDSVADLGLAWAVELEGDRALASTPLVANGGIYFADAMGAIHALDSRDGQRWWRYIPDAGVDDTPAGCCAAPHGIAIYGERILVGARDGRLIAVRAADGELAWRVPAVRDEAGRPQPFAAAPRVGGGKVFAVYGRPGAAGWLIARDVNDGGLAWRFRLEPSSASGEGLAGPNAGQAAALSVGNAIAYDAALQQVYLSGAAFAPTQTASGGAQDASAGAWSVVALDASTGAVAWRRDRAGGRISGAGVRVGSAGGRVSGAGGRVGAAWALILAEVKLDGVERLALLHVAPSGGSQVIDRQSGALLAAHPYTAAGEARPPLATRLARSAALDVGGPLGKVAARAHLDSAAIWPAAALDPAANVMYLPLAMSAATQLKAFNPLSGTARWSVVNANGNGAGVLGTAGGLVFQGDAAGALSAYDAWDGALRWRFDAGAPIHAPPITYEVEGAQHIAVLVSPGQGDGKQTAARMLAFRLGGAASMSGT